MSRRIAVLGALSAALVVALAASVAVGARAVAPGTVLDALTAYDPSSPAHVVVRELRVPRTLVGLAAAVALGLAGAVMQGMTRNPLADPGILGLNAGAALAVVVAIGFLGVTTPAGYVWFAFAGAASAGALVYALGTAGRRAPVPVTLALAGSAVAVLLSSVTGTVLLLDTQALEQYRFWVVGSLAGRDASVLVQVLPFLVVGAALCVAAAASLDAMGLGDDVARSLGHGVARARVLAGAGVVLLTGVAVSLAGPLAFVGLAVPHACRFLVGASHRWLLPACALLAPVLVLGSDVVGRVVAPPGEVQVGVVTAVLGAPLFIALVRQRRLVHV